MKNRHEEKITGVRFQRYGLVSYFECNGLMLIVGDKEMDNNTVSLRRRHKGNLGVFDHKKLYT